MRTRHPREVQSAMAPPARQTKSAAWALNTSIDFEDSGIRAGIIPLD